VAGKLIELMHNYAKRNLDADMGRQQAAANAQKEVEWAQQQQAEAGAKEAAAAADAFGADVVGGGEVEGEDEDELSSAEL
jgi:hypothetical protein